MRIFQVGESYKFTGDVGTFIVKFLGEDTDTYKVEVLGGTLVSEDNIGSKMDVYKTSRILRTFKCEKYNEKAKRKTKDELEVEKLLNHVSKQVTIDRLKREIDAALESGNKEEFLTLTKELNKLQKKVTA